MQSSYDTNCKTEIANIKILSYMNMLFLIKQKVLIFFPCSSNVGASSIYKPSGKYDRIEKYHLSDTVKVESIRLDRFLKDNDIGCVDLIVCRFTRSRTKSINWLR